MKEESEEDESAGEDKPPDMMNGDHQSEPQGSVKASSKAPSEKSQKSLKSDKGWWTSSWWDWKDWKAERWSKEETSTSSIKKPRDELTELLISIGGTYSQEDGKLEQLANLIDAHWQDALLPGVLTGWLLLQRSGLNGQERSTVIATSATLSQQDIERALKQQWQDTELKERDSKHVRSPSPSPSRHHKQSNTADMDEDDEMADRTSAGGSDANCSMEQTPMKTTVNCC